jgi:hypothetical protein
MPERLVRKLHAPQRPSAWTANAATRIALGRYVREARPNAARHRRGGRGEERKPTVV